MKETLPSTTSLRQNDSSVFKTPVLPSKTRSKINFTEIKIDTEPCLAPAKTHITENQNIYPLNYEQIRSFLNTTHGQSNLTEISEKYTKDTAGSINMLKEIQSHIIDRKLKGRIS